MLIIAICVGAGAISVAVMGAALILSSESTVYNEPETAPAEPLRAEPVLASDIPNKSETAPYVDKIKLVDGAADSMVVMRDNLRSINQDYSDGKIDHDAMRGAITEEMCLRLPNQISLYLSTSTTNYRDQISDLVPVVDEMCMDWENGLLTSGDAGPLLSMILGMLEGYSDMDIAIMTDALPDVRHESEVGDCSLFCDSSGYQPSWAQSMGSNQAGSRCMNISGDSDAIGSKDFEWCSEYFGYVLDSLG